MSGFFGGFFGNGTKDKKNNETKQMEKHNFRPIQTIEEKEKNKNIPEHSLKRDSNVFEEILDGKYNKDNRYITEEPSNSSTFNSRQREGHSLKKYEICDPNEEYKKGVECYNKGLYEQAIDFWKKACKQKHPASLFNLGLCYEKGVGVECRHDFAKKCYEPAAELGHAQAQCNLAVLIMEEEHTPNNVKAAFTWFKKSAEQGNFIAQCNLAICYYLGDGVNKDTDKAMYLFKIAANNGCIYARKKIEEIEKIKK